MQQDTQQHWGDTLAQLKNQMTKSQYEATLVASWLVESQDNKYTIAVPNQYAKEWLDNRLYDMVARTIATVTGEDIQLEFIIAEKPTPPPGQLPDPVDLERHIQAQRFAEELLESSLHQDSHYEIKKEAMYHVSYKSVDGQIHQIWRKIAPFVAHISEKTIILSDYGRTNRYKIEGTRQVKGKPQTFGFEVDADEWANTKAFASHILNNLPGKPPSTGVGLRAHWATGIAGLTDESKMKTTTALASTGWSPDGKAFVMPSGSVGKNYKAIITDPVLKSELQPFGLQPLEPESLHQAAADLFSLAYIYPPEMLYPIIAHMFLAPLVRFLGDEARYMLHIHAHTGSLKTELAKILMALYGPNGSQGITYKWSNTPFGAESRANALKDCIMLIDDLKPGTISLDDQQKWIALLQAAVDAQGRKRAGRGGGAGSSLPIRALLLSTGEAIPQFGEASFTARMLLVELHRQPKGRNTELDRIKIAASKFNGLMYHYIKWLMVEENQQKITTTYKTLQTEGLNIEMSHARLLSNYVSNRTAATALSLYLHDMGICNQEWHTHFLDTHQKGILKIIKTTSLRIEEQSYSVVFLLTLMDMINSRKVVLSPDECTNRIGWEDDKNIYFYLTSKGEADIWLQKTGQPIINIPAKTLRQQLYDDGYSLSTIARITGGYYDYQAKDPATDRYQMVIAIKKSAWDSLIMNSMELGQIVSCQKR